MRNGWEEGRGQGARQGGREWGRQEGREGARLQGRKDQVNRGEQVGWSEQRRVMGGEVHRRRQADEERGMDRHSLTVQPSLLPATFQPLAGPRTAPRRVTRRGRSSSSPRATTSRCCTCTSSGRTTATGVREGTGCVGAGAAKANSCVTCLASPKALVLFLLSLSLLFPAVRMD